MTPFEKTLLLAGLIIAWFLGRAIARHYNGKDPDSDMRRELERWREGK